ncbi:DMT family transporter [Solibacillus sp. FSL R7-0682]|uniref:DMT family transporter n=1 Tax=Solibacillus sp. FSL R7-0682 TaxID=2921690 RepID=UPI0030FA30B6
MKSSIQFLLSMIIFGTIGLVVRFIEISSSKIAFLSSCIGCIFLLFVFLRQKKRFSTDKIKRSAAILFFSAIALAGNWIFLYQSYGYTSLANATLGYYFAPVIVMMLSPFVLKEPLSLKKIACICVALIGMVFIIGNGFNASEKRDLVGILFGLMAASFYAALMLINKFIKGFDRLELTIVQLSLTALILLPYVLATEGIDFLSIPRASIPFILLLGIVNTGIGFWLYFSGMENMKGQSIAMLSYVDPFVAIIISSVLLLEPLTILQVIGGFLLLGSTFASEIHFKRN